MSVDAYRASRMATGEVATYHTPEREKRDREFGERAGLHHGTLSHEVSAEEWERLCGR